MNRANYPKGPRAHIVGFCHFEDRLVLANELKGRLDGLRLTAPADSGMSDAEMIEGEGFLFFNHCPCCGIALDPDGMLEGSAPLECAEMVPA